MSSTEIVLAVASAILTLGMSVAGFFAKSAVAELKTLGASIVMHGERLTRLEASELRSTVERHEARLGAVESNLSEIRGDMKHLVSSVDRLTAKLEA